MLKGRVLFFPVYLIAISVYQIVFTFWAVIPPLFVHIQVGLILNLNIVPLSVSDPEVAMTTCIAVWHLLVALSFFWGRPLLRTYIAIEVVIDLPCLYWFGLVLIFGGGHVFDRFTDLIPLSIILGVVSGIPLMLSIFICRCQTAAADVLPRGERAARLM